MTIDNKIGNISEFMSLQANQIIHAADGTWTVVTDPLQDNGMPAVQVLRPNATTPETIYYDTAHHSVVDGKGNEIKSLTYHSMDITA